MQAKAILFFFLEMLQIVAIALVVVLPIRFFVFQAFIVKGASMEPNFHNGDYLIVDELTYRFKSPERGEVVVFRYPQDTSQRFIKRVIGLPSENIELTQGEIIIKNKVGEQLNLDESQYLNFSDAHLALEDEKVILKEDEYFVMGDNRAHSFDSRKWGVLQKNFIVGRVIFRAWPFTNLNAFSAPAY